MSKEVHDQVERMRELARHARESADHLSDIASEMHKAAVKLNDAVKAEEASGLSDLLGGGSSQE